MRNNMLERFLRYIAYDTRSDDKSTTCPSTPGQKVLGAQLVEELKAMGIDNAHMDEKGYVYAHIKGNREVAPMGLIAHMDTATEMDGKCVNPQHIPAYQGGDIVLNDKYRLTEAEFPFLKEVLGHELITTDGTTLLGADDKAGIAIIMTVADYLQNHAAVPHGPVSIAFTPDEEIGRGADFFDVEKFGAEFAYTIDGGPIGELEYENFNAATAIVDIEGRNVHPGSAKNVMRNALMVAMELHGMLPVEARPEHTAGYEGFFHLNELTGDVGSAHMVYLIRDFFIDSFEAKKELLETAINFINHKYGPVARVEITDSYYNMREKVEPHQEIIDLAQKAMEQAGVTPLILPIRGGTDGARLSFMGLPTPNLFTGGYNYHGRFELLSVDSMEKALQTVKNIIALHAVQ